MRPNVVSSSSKVLRLSVVSEFQNIVLTMLRFRGPGF